MEMSEEQIWVISALLSRPFGKPPWRQTRWLQVPRQGFFQDQSTRNQVKVSFQDHPPNVPKMDPNVDHPTPLSIKMCIKRVLSRPFRMDLKMTLLSRPLVRTGKNQLLSRPWQIELKTLTPNTWSPLMRWVKSFQILSPGRRHNQSQNSRPVVHLLQDQDSTPSMWSQDQCPLTVPGIFRHCSPNSFDCIRDMEGEYNIKTDQTVPTSPAWKTESSHREQRGDWKGASWDGLTRNHHQSDWAHTMGQQPDIPQKGKWQVEDMPRPQGLEQGHHLWEPQSTNPQGDSSCPHRSHQVLQGRW